MTDRELLELAAKAAGIELRWHPDGVAYSDNRAPGYWGVWNPLTDDGDALRLAVRLRMRVYIDAGKVSAHYDAGLFAGETIYGDPYAATRRAIVRAAAEIGRAMP